LKPKLVRSGASANRKLGSLLLNYRIAQKCTRTIRVFGAHRADRKRRVDERNRLNHSYLRIVRPPTTIADWTWQISDRHNSASSALCTLFVLLGGPPCQLLPQSARREDDGESAVTPSAWSVQIKKQAPLDLAIAPPTPAPFIRMTGPTNPRSDPRRMIAYPDRLSASTSVPYSQMTRMGPPAAAFSRPSGETSRRGSRAETRWLT